MRGFHSAAACAALVVIAGCASGAFSPAIRNGAAPMSAQVSPAHDGATGLPGGEVGCPPVVGALTCSIVVNVEIPPISNPLTPAALIPGLHPADLRSAYAIPSQKAGTVVAIVDAFDDPSAEVDLAIYRAAFGLPSCTSLNGCFRKVNEGGVLGPLPSVNRLWGEEISIDLDMVSAACPKCSIILVEANSASISDLAAGVDRAVSLRAKVVSNSYYAGEWAAETENDAHYNHPGVAITVSTGDSGNTSYPAASRYVTAVGGTTLARSGLGWSEKSWQYDGHGCSAFVARPAWQPNTVPCTTRRSLVDVAAVADPKTGVSMFDSLAGGWLVAGGTSVGAALVAGEYGLSGNFASPAYSYAHSRAFRDVPPGGFDLITGLGSPLGVSGL